MTLLGQYFRKGYSQLGEEAVVINVLATALLALAIVMPLLLLYDKFRSRPIQVIAVNQSV